MQQNEEIFWQILMGVSIKLSPFVLSGKGDNLFLLMGANSKLSPFVKLGKRDNISNAFYFYASCQWIIKINFSLMLICHTAKCQKQGLSLKVKYQWWKT